MKKFLILFLLLLALPCYALEQGNMVMGERDLGAFKEAVNLPALSGVEVARLSAPMMGAGVVAAGTPCSTDTDFVGYKTVSVGATVSIGENAASTMLVAPTCDSGCTSGTATLGYIQHWGTGTDNVKVCFWEDDGDETPDTGDALIGCTAELTSSTSEEIVNGAISGTIDCSKKYWVGGISDATTWLLGYNDVAGTVIYGANGASWYATPPSTMSGTWSSGGIKKFVVYVTIGP